MENQLWQDTLGCCNQHQERPQDADDILFLLLGLIILVNICINLATVMWRRLQNALDMMVSWINQLNEVQASECSPNDLPAKAQDIHLHCILDPVQVEMARPARCSSSSHHHLHKCQSLSCSRCHQSRRQRRRRQHGCHRHQRQFLQSRPLTFKKPHNHRMPQLEPAPFFDLEDRDSSPQEDDLLVPHPKYPPGGWDRFCKPVGLASNVGLWGRQGGILANCPLPSLHLSPELHCLPKPVEAKSERRLQAFGPYSSQSPILGNVEVVQGSPSPPPPRQLLPAPSWVARGHSPSSPGGYILYEAWDRKRLGVVGSEPHSAFVSRNSQSEAQGCQEYNSPQSHRRRLLGYTHSQPNCTPPQSMGPLGCSSSDSHEVCCLTADWTEVMPTDWTEVMPTRQPLDTSASLTALGEASYQRAPAASSGSLLRCSQPLPEVQADPTPCPPTFVPLSRNPGGNASYQVYDSLELKRKVQESKGKANCPSPPSTSASRPSLHRCRAEKFN